MATLCDGFKIHKCSDRPPCRVYVSPLSILAGFLWGFVSLIHHFILCICPLGFLLSPSQPPFYPLCCCSVTKSCPTLCDPMDCSTSGFPVLPSPRVCSNSCPLSQWCHPAISSSDTLFSCHQSFPASGTYPMSQLFSLDEENTGVSTSASVLTTSIQGWSPLRLTGLISLLSKGLSGIFFSTIVQRHQFFGVTPSLPSSSHNRTWPLGRP